MNFRLILARVKEAFLLNGTAGLFYINALICAVFGFSGILRPAFTAFVKCGFLLFFVLGTFVLAVNMFIVGRLKK